MSNHHMPDNDLSDEQWRRIELLLPAVQRRRARPAHDHRRFLNGMLYVLREGCVWRDMAERYGSWNSIYVRFKRWAEQGTWDSILPALVELGITEHWRPMTPKHTLGKSWAAGKSRGKFSGLLIAHAAQLRAGRGIERSIAAVLNDECEARKLPREHAHFD